MIQCQPGLSFSCHTFWEPDVPMTSASWGWWSTYNAPAWAHAPMGSSSSAKVTSPALTRSTSNVSNAWSEDVSTSSPKKALPTRAVRPSAARCQACAWSSDTERPQIQLVTFCGQVCQYLMTDTGTAYSGGEHRAVGRLAHTPPVGLHWLGWHGGHGVVSKGPEVMPARALASLSDLHVLGWRHLTLMLVRLFRQTESDCLDPSDTFKARYKICTSWAVHCRRSLQESAPMLAAGAQVWAGHLAQRITPESSISAYWFRLQLRHRWLPGLLNREQLRHSESACAVPDTSSSSSLALSWAPWSQAKHTSIGASMRVAHFWLPKKDLFLRCIEIQYHTVPQAPQEPSVLTRGGAEVFFVGPGKTVRAPRDLEAKILPGSCQGNLEFSWGDQSKYMSKDNCNTP